VTFVDTLDFFTMILRYFSDHSTLITEKYLSLMLKNFAGDPQGITWGWYFPIV